LKVDEANRIKRSGRLIVGICVFAAAQAGFAIAGSSAQQLAVQADHQRPKQNPSAPKPLAGAKVAWAVAASSVTPPVAEKKPAAQLGARTKGPYYVDFRARTAASYGHAFVWFGKTSEKQVEVAGLHPAGDELPYILGHLIWVPAETGASYGDLDVQYLTASYRVYLSEADAKNVFAYIKHLQATSLVWNAETTNCTSFIGRIAAFMGLRVPSHLMKPEAYVNELKEMNGGRNRLCESGDCTSKLTSN
jgi:hypothetical protein